MKNLIFSRLGLFMFVGMVLGAVGGQFLVEKAFALNPSAMKYGKSPMSTPAPMAPGIPANVALVGTTSAGTTLAITGQCVRISCSVACQYRVTVGSSTAVATDNELPAGTPERFCLTDTQNTITFFSATAGTAKVAIQAGAAQ